MKSVGLFDSFKERKSQIFCIFLSLCGSWGIILSLKTGADAGNYQNNFGNNILYFVLVYLLYKIWNELIKNFERRNLIISLICGFLFSCLLILGSQLDYFGGITWTILTVAKIILLAVAMCPIVYKIFRVCDEHQIANTKMVLKKKYWWISFGLIFFCLDVNIFSSFSGSLWI